MGPISCSETSVAIILRRLTFQKREYFIYTALEAWSHAMWLCLYIKTCIKRNFGHNENLSVGEKFYSSEDPSLMYLC